MRAAVGGGSYTTINEAMKEWKAKQQAANTKRQEPAPESISQQLNELGTDIWALALELANARLILEREELEATRNELETAQQEATELAERLRTELEALQATHQETLKTVQTTEAVLQLAKQENTELRHQLANSQVRVEERMQEIQRLNATLVGLLRPAVQS